MKPTTFFLLLTLAAASLQATTIVGVDGATGGFAVGIFPSQAIAVSFSVDQSYSDVSIEAFLAGNFVGTAYLTSQIGAGTTVADQFDTGSFTAVGTGLETTIFDDIDLDPGTYYLVLSTATSSGTRGIWGTATPTVTTDTGASAVAGYYTANNPTGYIPSAFGIFHTADSLEFDVTTPAASPEPAAWTMLLAGLLLVAARIHRGPGLFRKIRTAFRGRPGFSPCWPNGDLREASGPEGRAPDAGHAAQRNPYADSIRSVPARWSSRLGKGSAGILR